VAKAVLFSGLIMVIWLYMPTSGTLAV